MKSPERNYYSQNGYDQNNPGGEDLLLHESFKDLYQQDNVVGDLMSIAGMSKKRRSERALAHERGYDFFPETPEEYIEFMNAFINGAHSIKIMGLEIPMLSSPEIQKSLQNSVRDGATISVSMIHPGLPSNHPSWEYVESGLYGANPRRFLQKSIETLEKLSDAFPGSVLLYGIEKIPFYNFRQIVSIERTKTMEMAIDIYGEDYTIPGKLPAIHCMSSTNAKNYENILRLHNDMEQEKSRGKLLLSKRL